MGAAEAGQARVWDLRLTLWATPAMNDPPGSGLGLPSFLLHFCSW